MVQVWHGLDEVPADWGRCAVTIGVFDGVHRGHQRVIGRAVERGRDEGIPTVAITLDPHPLVVLVPSMGPPAALTTLETRARLMGEIGVDAMLILPFTSEFARVSAEDFVRQVLIDGLHAAVVVVGENFRFGHKAAGDLALLKRLGDAGHFVAEGVELLKGGSKRQSSSLVRELVAEGDVTAAAEILGRPHAVEGLVVRGDGRGRDLGFPTANVATPEHTAVPADGVYAGWLTREKGPDRERLPAAISVGTNPTFLGTERKVEAYVLDRDDLELYGSEVTVEFTTQLRGRETLRFSSVEELVEQMRYDVDDARTLLERDRSSPAR